MKIINNMQTTKNMKNQRKILPFYSLILCLLLTVKAHAVTALSAITPPENYENIYVHALGSDQYASEYIVFVKKAVKAHYHAEHTELVYVLEGTGIMQLGEQQKQVKAGDFIRINQGVIHSVKVTSDKAMKVLSIQTPEFKGKDRIFIDDNQ